jgi:hypothetical protein
LFFSFSFAVFWFFKIISKHCIYKKILELGLEIHACSPSYQETEAGRSLESGSSRPAWAA